jgi:prepilin-type N-terminal cleavage/methylation domain-containing protein
MRAARGRSAGFTLIEVTIVLALTLVVAAIVYKVTRSSWLLYQSQTHVTERGFSGVRALDDMAVEIAREGFGLGSDAGPLFPGTLAGVRGSDAITVRSNPGGVATALQEDLLERDQLVPVEEAALFAEGDVVLLVDEERTLERAQVARVGPGSLALRSLDGPDGRLVHSFLTSLGARVLKVREVAFFLKTESSGAVVLARKATGQAEQILARYVGVLRFGYLDETGQPMDPADIGPGRVPGGVEIALALVPNPDLPPVTVPPLSRRLSLEPQSATVAFDPFAYHTIGVAAVIGQDPGSAEKKLRMHAWPKPLPRF